MGFPNTSNYVDPWGNVRWRFRKKGLPTVYLKGLPGSPEFAESYRAATEGTRPQVGAKRTQPGTLHALAVTVYASAEWSQLSPATQTTYRGIIERVRRDYGDLPVARLTKANVLAMRDRKAGSPTAANNLVKVLRWALKIAVTRNMRADNPTDGIEPLKIESDGFHTWEEEEIATFEKRWPVGTRQRLAMDLLLYTAQRSGDVRQMGRQHVSNGLVSVKQEKTRTRLQIPVHPKLARSLATVPAGQMIFVLQQFGEPYTAAGFSNWFSHSCRKAGLLLCSAHGLRKSAATRLADAGCSEAQIMAVTGHQTAKEVQRYTRARDQRHLAQSAFAKIGGTDGEQKLAKPTNRLAKSSPKTLE